MESTKHRITKSADSEGAIEELEALKSSFGQLREDVIDLFSHAFGVGRGGARAAKAVAKESATDAMEQLKSKISELNDKGADSVAAVERKIEENPLPAALIAFGVGFIAAKIFSRR